MKTAQPSPSLPWHQQLAFLTRLWAYALSNRVLPVMGLLLLLLGLSVFRIVSMARQDQCMLDARSTPAASRVSP